MTYVHSQSLSCIVKMESTGLPHIVGDTIREPIGGGLICGICDELDRIWSLDASFLNKQYGLILAEQELLLMYRNNSDSIFVDYHKYFATSLEIS